MTKKGSQVAVTRWWGTASLGFSWDFLCAFKDGKYLSNTYALEHGMNWTGILIEPLAKEAEVGKLSKSYGQEGSFIIYKVLGGSSQLGYVVNNHGDRKSPKDRVVGPLTNGRSLWLINGGY